MALINCPDCGSQVSDAAPACPKCGRPIAGPAQATSGKTRTPPPKKSNHVSGVTVLVAFGLLGWFLYSMATSDNSGAPAQITGEPAPEAPPRPEIEVTPDQLQTAYDTNEVAADNIYKGKGIRIVGVVESIDKDFTDDVVIRFVTKGQLVGVSATLKDSEKTGAASLQKGQELSVDCERVMRVVGTPSATHCVFSPRA